MIGAGLLTALALLAIPPGAAAPVDCAATLLVGGNPTQPGSGAWMPGDAPQDGRSLVEEAASFAIDLPENANEEELPGYVIAHAGHVADTSEDGYIVTFVACATG